MSTQASITRMDNISSIFTNLKNGNEDKYVIIVDNIPSISFVVKLFKSNTTNRERIFSINEFKTIVTGISGLVGPELVRCFVYNGVDIYEIIFYPNNFDSQSTLSQTISIDETFNTIERHVVGFDINPETIMLHKLYSTKVANIVRSHNQYLTL